MSLYNMLPFLEGWKGVTFTKTETVKKGEYKSVFSEQSKGWLLALNFVSDDAYASVKISYLGYAIVYTPHSFFILALTEPPPMGSYISEYIRPSTLSTAAICAVSIITSAYPQPIKGLVRIELGLELDSTQATAAVAVTFDGIDIVDMEAFIRSVRKFQYGWLGWAFGVLSRIPGLKYIGIPDEIKEVIE